ncbi:hypothetical protein ACYX7E_09950 [Luteimonas sp. RIT-PG2_3]
MSLETELQRGQFAQAVLDNPVYQDAFTKIEEGLTRAWRESRSKDEREELHQLLRMLEKVNGLISGVMRSGEVSKDRLTKRATVVQRIGQRLSGG